MASTTTTVAITTTTEPYRLPEGITFDADEGGERDLGLVKTIVTLANEAFGRFFGAEVVEAAIFVYEDLDGQRMAVSNYLGVDPAHLRWGTPGQAWPKAAAFYTGRGTGTMSPSEDLVIHELLHVLQHQLAHPKGDLLNLLPSWMAEGGAEYAADSVRKRLGRLRGDTDRGAGCRGLGIRLEDLEGPDAGAEVYCTGFNAVRMLAEHYGDEALLDFWAQQGAGASWTESFQSTFGKSVEDFYSEFEQWNAAGDD